MIYDSGSGTSVWITLNDANYWDSTHYTVEIANQLEDILGAVVMEGASVENPSTLKNNKNKPYRVLEQRVESDAQTTTPGFD